MDFGFLKHIPFEEQQHGHNKTLLEAGKIADELFYVKIMNTIREIGQQMASI